MLKFIIVNLFKFIYPFVSRKFNFSPKVDDLVNTVFKTNFNNRKIDIKTDKAILLKSLAQATSKEEADKIRSVLKEQDKKKQLPANLLALIGVIAIIVISFNMNSSTDIGDGLYLIGAIIIGLYLFYMSKRKQYQCQYCFITSKLSEYEKLDMQHTGTRQTSTTQSRYLGQDQFFHYYTTDVHNTITNFYDRKSKCPCCGYEQIIKVKRTTRI